MSCGDTKNINGTKVLLGRSCENPLTRIIWDGGHYAEAANKWVFDRIVGLELSDPLNALSMAYRRDDSKRLLAMQACM